MTIKTQYNDTANENSKSFVVPDGMIWKLMWAHMRYTSDATVGNRQIRLQVLDDTGASRFDTHAGAVQAASLDYHYEFMQGIYRETSFVDNAIQVPIPECLYLLPGWTLKIYDATGVSATDDMIVSIQYSEEVFRVEI